MNFFHFYIRISFDKWAFRISKLEYLTGWICYITQHHILLIYWVSTSLGGAETISDCWFHSIFQFFWDDDPYDDNECYQTYQTFKPGKTEKKKQKIPRVGVVAVFHVFSQGPWGGDMGLIAGIEAWSSVLLGLGIAALSGKLVGGARGFRIDMPMSSRKSGDIWKLKVGVEDVELVNTPW